MDSKSKNFVHVSIDAVDVVAFDPGGRFDAETYDHYVTFEEARDAALSCVELLLDEGDYDGEDHRQELEQMRGLLEGATTLEGLESQPAYRWFVEKLGPTLVAA